MSKNPHGPTWSADGTATGDETAASAASAASGPGAPPAGTYAGMAAGSAPPAPVLSAAEQDTLAAAFDATLAAGIHGLCFSPYLDGQGPGTVIGEAQIRARMQVIQPHTRWVRSFSCTDGNELIPRVAQEMGLKTLVGAWLGTDAKINEAEIAGVIELARAGHADIVAVGNEVLLREDLSEDELLGFIRRVRDALPGVQVGYVDAYYLFELHPRITEACDVVLTNCYPFWEGCPLELAIAYMRSMYTRTLAAAGGKKVIISETGWPNIGSAFHGAVPSVAGAMRYFVDTCAWAERDGIDVFYFAAFDEAWKVGAEGDVGAYWGLWDKLGAAKYTSRR